MMINFEKLKEQGYIEIESCDNDISEIAALLGAGLNTSFVPAVSILRPQLKSEKFSKSLSGNYGYGSFPYHTDGAHYRIPPQYIVIRSLSELESKTPTMIFDPLNFIKDQSLKNLFEHEMYLAKLNRASLYTTIVSKTILPGNIVCRYNPVIMKKLSPETATTSDDMLQMLCSIESREVKWTKNRTVIIDNWRMLHARGNVPEDEIKTRVLERTYLFNTKYHE